MSRPRKQAPEWPKSLQLPQARTETGPAAVAPPSSSVPLLAFFFGLAKDGRHLAAELRVDGTRVIAMVPLSASLHAEPVAKAWEACAFYRLCHGREYTDVEAAANAREGGALASDDLREGHAVAIASLGGKSVALAMDVEGTKVLEPKVLGSGARLFAWQEVHTYAQRWFLPKRHPRRK